jgi:hypothetical protein
MSDPAEIIQDLEPAARRAVVAAMDQLTRPLRAREIEQRLRGVLNRRNRDALIYALKDVAIIAIVKE